MRIIVAIVLLAISTLSLAVGIAERTVFEEPETIERVITTETKAPATIIPGSVLTSYPGRQTITVQGGVSGLVPDESGKGFLRQESNQAFVAYGSTLDVMAWLAPGRHTKLSYDPVLTELSQLPRSGDTFLPDPQGSDLWFNEFSGEGDVTLSLAGNEDITVLVMTDGVLPAPQTITISWPGATEAPWILAALILGVVTFFAGIIIALSSLISWRDRRGPRRKRTRVTRPPRRRSPGYGRAGGPSPTPTRKRGRRVAPRVVFPLVGGLVLGLGACATPAIVENEGLTETTAVAPNPAVTESQFATIMARVAGQIQLADQELSVNTLNPRVTEPTLSARRVAYIVTRADAEAQRVMPIPSSPIRLVLPQQTTGWPRSVFAVIQDEQDLESPSLGVVLRQEDPRSNYRLTYAIVLNPQVELPDLPPATLGAAKLRADSKLTRVTPSALLAHYADVANSGADSPFVGEFSLATDTLYSQMGPEALQLRQESFGDSVEVSWSTSVTDREIVAFSTSNAGALVMGTLRQVERVEPVQSGATVNSSIGIRALTSLSQSSVGFDVDSDVQILFYVPPVGSEEGVRVLGYTYSLVAAREVGNE